MEKSMQSVSREAHMVAMLAAFCMFFSMIEYLIPKPLPFMRLGLANLPILIALFLLSDRKILLLIFLKVLGQGLVNGTLFSYIFLFSAAGTLCSGTAMLLIFKAAGKRVSLIGICLAGALVSNMVQLVLARFFIFGRSAFIIGPPFLIIGTVSALILGFFAERFVEQSKWFALQRGERNG
ncbi:MAG: Gx transporter family protein [Spirochaetales bacterium]|nr:Gx transporter family protein [Spirochaetales bacterium]